MKQENAVEDSASVTQSITQLFSAMNMPMLADVKLYLGISYSILKEFHNALQTHYDDEEKKRFHNRLRYAGITKERSENVFQWDENTYPFVAPGIIEEALSINFVREGKNLIIVGPSGTGKTLLSIIISCKILRQGLSVKYKTSHNLSVELKEAKAGNSLSGCIKKLQSCDVLVMDDLTFATFDSKTAQSFHAVIDSRYARRKTIIITANSSIKEWMERFPDKTMRSAILGRFYEDALLINMNGAEDVRFERAKLTMNNTSQDSVAKPDDKEKCEK